MVKNNLKRSEKKTIRILSLDPNIDRTNFLSHYKFDELENKYEFLWDNIEPEYILVSRDIYVNRNCFLEFMKRWKDGRSKKQIYIQYIEEAFKPDLNLFDYAVCYDDELNLSDRIIRLPPVHSFFKRFCTSEVNSLNDKEAGMSVLKNKKKFCAFMYSHSFLERDNMFKLLNKYKKVDSLGVRYHNTVYHPTGYNGHERETTDVYLPYKFVIAGENAKYSGYTSEKIVTALQAHAVPIYWGNPHIENDFNGKAFINTMNFQNREELLDYIIKIDNNDDLWSRMVCESWQTNKQIEHEDNCMREYLSFFDTLFSQSVVSAKRLEYGSHLNWYQSWFFSAIPQKSNLINDTINKVKLLTDKRYW